jgi:MbtH protein
MKDNWSMDGDFFKVLINTEGQYSLWPSAKEIPVGWDQVGEKGTKEECLELVETKWTDMRPNSLKAV